MRAGVLVAALASTLLSACATLPEGASRLLAPATSITLGGETFQAIGRASDPGSPYGFAVRSRADRDALYTLTQKMGEMSLQAADADDLEGFLVARAAQRVLLIRLIEQEMGRKALMSSLFSRKDGKAELLAGASVFLPYLDDSTPMMRLSISPWLDWSAGVQVAQLDGLMRAVGETMKDVLDGVETGYKWTRGRDILEKEIDVIKQDMLKAMPAELTEILSGMAFGVAPEGHIDDFEDGIVYRGTDEQGREYFVERTRHGYVLHNRGDAPVLVPLEKIGYLPLAEEMSPTRKAARPYIDSYQRSLRQHWQAHVQPNNFRCRGNAIRQSGALSWLCMPDGQAETFISPSGALSSARQDGIEAARKFALDPAFAHAMGLFLTDRPTGEFSPEMVECFSVKGNKSWMAFEGRHFEKQRITCELADRSRSGAATLLYSYLNYVTDSGSLLSYESLLDDRRLAHQIEGLESRADLIDAVTAFIPVLSNFEAGARCLTDRSIIERAFLGSQHKSLMGMRSRIAHLLPEVDDVSMYEKALDCAGAIPAVGTVASLTAKGVNRATSRFNPPEKFKNFFSEKSDNLAFNEGTVAHSFMQNAKTAAEMFDSYLLWPPSTIKTARHYRIMATEFTSPRSAIVAKAMYDLAQHHDNMTDLSAAVLNN